MRHCKAYVDAVQVGDRHRAVSQEKVKILADSMDALGLQQPISLWFDENDVGYLVAGHHRLEAAKLLNWEEIDAIELDMTTTQREMWQISENLHRVGLTKEERDKHIRRYAELLEKAKEQVLVQNDPKPKSGPQGGRPKGVASQIAEETGVSKSTVKRALNPPLAPSEADLWNAEQDRKKRETSKIELLDYLLDTLTPQQWDRLIDLMDAAGGTLKSQDLVRWQSPMVKA